MGNRRRGGDAAREKQTGEEGEVNATRWYVVDGGDGEALVPQRRRCDRQYNTNETSYVN